jgi:hypothetical protein
VTLLGHFGPPVSLKTYFRVDQFNGGGSCSGKNYLLQRSTAIGIAMLRPFLGVSSLNFGLPARVAFFLGTLFYPSAQAIRK